MVFILTTCHQCLSRPQTALHRVNQFLLWSQCGALYALRERKPFTALWNMGGCDCGWTSGAKRKENWFGVCHLRAVNGADLGISKWGNLTCNQVWKLFDDALKRKHRPSPIKIFTFKRNRIWKIREIRLGWRNRFWVSLRQRWHLNILFYSTINKKHIPKITSFQ